MNYARFFCAACGHPHPGHAGLCVGDPRDAEIARLRQEYAIKERERLEAETEVGRLKAESANLRRHHGIVTGDYECQEMEAAGTALYPGLSEPTPRGARGGFAAIAGKWPGDETDAEVAAALGESVPPKPAKWRVGRKVGRTVYREESLVGVMDTPELARLVVDAVSRTSGGG